MEKISRILPPSARTQAAEVSRSQPARPGAPEMGRVAGKNSQGDRLTLSKEFEALRDGGAFADPMATYPNSAEGKKMKVVDDLNKKFFTRTDVHREPGQAAKSENLTEATYKAPTGGLFVVEKDLRPELQPVKAEIQE